MNACSLCGSTKLSYFQTLEDNGPPYDRPIIPTCMDCEYQRSLAKYRARLEPFKRSSKPEAIERYKHVQEKFQQTYNIRDEDV